LGGKDIDQKIVNWLSDEFKAEYNIDLRNDKMALQRLYEAAENAKKELSSSLETEINLPFITADQTGPKHLVKKLTRAKFESMIEDFTKETLKHVTNALDQAGLKPSDIDEVVLVGGTTRIPYIQNEISKYFNGKKLNKSVNPDEVVALGAAIQSAVLKGDIDNVLLLDVTPLTLGIETLGGVVTPIIEKGTTIPVKKSQIFSTAEDNQPAVTIHVVQGEAKLASDNKSLGQFNLEGIPPAPRGVPQIEVTFDIDANGILTVSAKDKATGKEQNITITGSSGLSEEEINRMIKEAEESNNKNKEKLETIEAKNKLDSLVNSIDKFIKDNKSDLTKELETILDEAKTKIKEDNISKAEIESLISKLETEYQNVGQKIYQQNQSSQTSQTSANNEDDDVIDAEVA